MFLILTHVFSIYMSRNYYCYGMHFIVPNIINIINCKLKIKLTLKLSELNWRIDKSATHYLVESIILSTSKEIKMSNLKILKHLTLISLC